MAYFTGKIPDPTDCFTLKVVYTTTFNSDQSKVTVDATGYVKRNKSTVYPTSNYATAKMTINGSTKTLNGNVSYNLNTDSYDKIISYSKSVSLGTASSKTFTIKLYFDGNRSSYYPIGSVSKSITVTRTKYTIKFDLNGGDGSSSQATKYHGIDLPIDEWEPTRSGYNFLGWATKADAKTPEYTIGSVFSKNDNTTLYAVWQTATLIKTKYTIPSYTITNNDIGQAVVGNCEIPFTLITTSDNSSMNYYYKVFYSHSISETSSTVTKKISAGTTSGKIILNGDDIKEHILTTNNSSINITVYTYTGEAEEGDDENVTVYNLSIPIINYGRNNISLNGCRNQNNDVVSTVIIDYPVSFNINPLTCVPSLYFNDTLLNVSPSSASVDEDNTATYEYVIPSSKIPSAGYLVAKFDDGINSSQAKAIIVEKYPEQKFKVNFDGSCESTEFIEVIGKSLSIKNNGSCEASDFIEGQPFNVTSEYTVETLELNGNARLRTAYIDGDLEISNNFLYVVDDVGIEKNIFDYYYPIDSVYITSTNENPYSILHFGSWELIDKEFSNMCFTENNITTAGRFFTPKSIINSHYFSVIREGHEIQIRFYYGANSSIADKDTELGTINLSELGVTSLCQNIFVIGGADLGNVIQACSISYTGLIKTIDTIGKTSGTLEAGNTMHSHVTFNVPMEFMMDSACDKFYWKRIA